MAQLYGKLSETGKPSDWNPLSALKDILSRYVLRVSDSGIPKHYNGNADIAAASVALGATTRHIKVQNTHGANTVSVSFDSGTNFFTIAAGEVLDLDAEISSVDIKASVNGTPYEILTIE